VELCTSCWEALILMGVTVVFVLEQKNEGDKTNTISEKKTMMWNQRLGHIGEKALQTLHGKGMIEGISNCTLDFDFRENCIHGKQN
jgi:hypothetical protein